MGSITYDVFITPGAALPWINIAQIADPDNLVETIPPGSGQCDVSGLNPFDGPS